MRNKLLASAMFVVIQIILGVLFSFATGRFEVDAQEKTVAQSNGKHANGDDSSAKEMRQKVLKACVLAQEGDVRGLQQLLKEDASVAKLNLGFNRPGDEEFGETALHYAARYNQVGSIRVLVKAGANLAARDLAWRYTPLHAAAKANALEATRELIALGADKDIWGHGPLYDDAYADGLRSLGIAEPYASPLDAAAENGAAEVVEYLLSIKCKLDINDEKSRYSALHRACNGIYRHKGLGDPRRVRDSKYDPAKGNSAVIQLLLDHGASLSTKDWAGNTPMHVAIRHKAGDTVAFLFSKYPERMTVNEEGQFENSPLFLALTEKRGSSEDEICGIVSTLLKHGADKHAKSGSAIPRQTPFEFAMKQKRGQKILDLLR